MFNQQMIENIEQSVQLCQQKAETMMKKYEYVVVDAQTIFQAQAAQMYPCSRVKGGGQKWTFAGKPNFNRKLH